MEAWALPRWWQEEKALYSSMRHANIPDRIGAAIHARLLNVVAAYRTAANCKTTRPDNLCRIDLRMVSFASGE
jgi:hypothetical protein